jgi:hypothetical protein
MLERTSIATHVVAGVSLAFFLQLQGVTAATPCTFDDQLVALNEVRMQASGSSLTDTRAEVVVRREILRAVTTCVIKEAEELRNKLTTLSLRSNGETERVRTFLHGELNSTLTFYHIQFSKINDLGIRGSQDAARQLKEWRINIYRPLADRVVNFIIWNKNTELLDIANRRVDDVFRGTAAFGNSKETETLLETTRMRLEEAHNNHRRAGELFAQSARSGNVHAEETLDAIKDSLHALSETYKALFDLYQLIAQ